MDSKSSHHKQENRYKFESFTERISSINVDVIRRQPQVTDVLDEDGDSYFVAGLAKWSDLNCTQDFVNFTHEVSFDIRNFAQLVHHREECLSKLKKHLRVKPSMAYLPLLDLVVQIARDLQKDMYPHFEDFFVIIVDLLDTQDTELIEGAFQTLGYLFKFLWRYLVKDIKKVFSLYSVLLTSNKKEHIQRFAAESFAFLLRKVKAQDDFFAFLFRELSKNPDQVTGVGRLFFEMMKSVRKQLHSCAPSVLSLLLSKLRAEDGDDAGDENSLINCELVHRCLLATVQSICRYVNKESALVVWQCLLDAASSVHNQLVQVSTERKTDEAACQQLSFILHLMEILVRYGQGKLLTNPKQLVQLQQNLTSGKVISKIYRQNILDLLSALLLAKRCPLGMEQTTSLVSSVFTSNFQTSQILAFCRAVMEMDDFEGILLPKLLEYVHKQVTTAKTTHEELEVILFTLVELIMVKSPSQVDPIATTFDPYPLDFSIVVERMKISSKRKKRQSRAEDLDNFPGHLLTAVERYLDGGGTRHYIWAVLMCLPNVRPLDKERASKLLKKLISKLENEMTETTNEKELDVIKYVLSCAVRSCLCCSEPEKVLDLQDTILRFLKSYPASEHILLAAESWYNEATTSSIAVDFSKLRELYHILQENLSSPSSKVRLLTLRILGHIPVTLPEQRDVPTDPVSVLEVCLRAEEVPLSLDTYREKLMHLRKLEHEAIAMSGLPTDLDCSEVALRYLIGMLHVNLQLLWEPVIELIKSHGYGMDKKKFWSVYHPVLLQASADVRMFKPQARQGVSSKSLPVTETTKPQSLSDLLEEAMRAGQKISDRPDPINFKNLLWKAMGAFPDCVEKKTRDLVPMVLDFVKSEYNIIESFLAPSQNIAKRKDEEEECDPDETAEELEVETEDRAGKRVTYSKTKLQKSLVTQLQLFSKFRNPKAFFQESKMRELFFRLLSSPHAPVQKAALDCLMTYKFKYLQPYTDQFSGLMEDKSFSEALLLFNIDEESGLIEEEHRKGLLPVLFRILYGKMLSRAGAGPQGKSGVGYRRSLILRFLGGSKETEMKIFLDLLFEPFADLLDDNCSAMLKNSLAKLDTSAVIPLRRQYSIVETCGILFSRVGHLIGSYTTTILHILITMVANCNSLLDKRDQLQPYAIKLLKNLRQSLINRLEQFFEVYDEYPFTTEEIDALFDGAVWPQLNKLPNEGLAGPTPLLKIFHQWSKQPRLHVLFAKHHRNQGDLYAVPGCIALLSSSLAAQPTVAMVMDIVHNLLNVVEDPDPNEDDAALIVSDLIDMSKVKVSTGEEDASVGVHLIHPFVSPILQYLKSAVKPRKSRTALPLKEIRLLSKLSSFVDDPLQCTNLISLLLPYLDKTKEKHEDIEVDILNTVKNLVIYVDDSSQFMNKLSKCFQRLSSRNSRRVLCDVVVAMSTRMPDLEESAKFVQDLNSWDKKRLDEPDYLKRIAAFKLVNEKVDNMKVVHVTFMSLMLDNAFYFVLKMDEMSMRDNSSHFLINFIKRSSAMESCRGAVENLIHSKYLASLKEGVKSRKESVRHECVAILSEAVRHFPHLDVFSKMTVLHDKDNEKDFYENIRHIQIHRRVRALRKLAKHCRQSELDVRGVRNFLLPIVTGVIFDPVLASKNENVVLEAVDCVGAIASTLPWGSYFVLFKQFLRLLLKDIEQQKLAVRLLVAILEAFHFDLSSSEHVPQAQPDFPSHEVDQVEDESVEEKKDSEETRGDGMDIDDDEDEDKEAEDEEIKGSKVAENNTEQATRIHKTILNSVIPKLLEIFSERTRRDQQHKTTRDNEMDENEILRIPLTVAMVKLIKQLPHSALDTYLPSIVLKVCNILKHRIMNVRDIARDCLVKILQTAGVAHFDGILHLMSNTLTRGYQVHVLGYSVHALIKSIRNLKSGDLDKSLGTLIKILNRELFGELSEEKEVAAIISKLPEAKGSRAFDCYEIIGKVIGESFLTTLILPLKELLDTTHSHKVVNKVREVLRRFSLGLVANSALSVESMMIFIHSLASDTLHLVTSFEKAKAALEPPPDPRLRPASVYLLPPKPKRWGESANMGRKTNMHVLMEFGLLLLHNALKTSKLSPSKELHLRMLDPFVDILTKALGAKTNVVISVSLRCLTNMLRFPLPSLESSSEEITKSLFHLLKRNAVAGVTKGDNLELVTNTFKAVTVLVRDIKHHNINEKQLQVLLAYAEEDIHDYTRQATAFTLLRAILSKKLVVPEIHDVLLKVRQLAITSETPSVRAQCRQVDLQYLLDYPLGKKIKTPLEFYVSQLSYRMESGRRSALDMLISMFNTFPERILTAFAGLFFIPLSIRLVNDESASCRRLSASTLKTLLKKLKNKKRDELFGMVQQWMADDDAGHQRLAIQLCGVFVEAEGTEFGDRLGFLLTSLEEKVRKEHWDQETFSPDPADEKESDHLLFHMLSCLLKVFKICRVIKSKEFEDTLNQIWKSIEEHLLHPHGWIRVITAQLYGELFATWPPAELIKVFEVPGSGHGDHGEKSPPDGREAYILSEGRSKVKVLTTKFCGQLLSSHLRKEHANQVLKNLVYLGKVMHRVYPMSETDRLTVDEGFQGGEDESIPTKDVTGIENQRDVDAEISEKASAIQNEVEEIPVKIQGNMSIAWMVRKLCWISGNEAFRSNTETFKRTSVVKWFAALALDMDPEDVRRCLPPMIRVLLRCIDDHNKHNDDNLKVLCQEVLELLKGVVELEFFTRTYADVQRSRQEKRLQRKRQKAIEAVANPEEAAKKKMKKNLQKKEAKKRKLKSKRPTYSLAKRMKSGT